MQPNIILQCSNKHANHLEMQTMISIPFRLDFSNLAVDYTVSFCVAILVAVIVNAEGQAFAATLLGDARQDSKDRFHFNAFLHLDLWGTICFFIAGFGWSKPVDIRADKFSHPVLFMILSRLAGPVSNFLMACIAGSIVWLMGRYGVEDRVFIIVMSVNLASAVYLMLPIPPLTGAGLIFALFPKLTDQKRKMLFHHIGSVLIIAIFLAERISGVRFISRFIDPIIQTLFRLILG
jgi:hypothetical protein